MAVDPHSGMQIVAKDATTIEISLPEGDSFAFPQIPESLQGKELPPFVLEWVLDTGEVGMLIQEILQAPTQSLCRIAPVPTGPANARIRRKPFGAEKLIRRPIYSPRKMPDVLGFEAASQDSPAMVEGLPEGIKLPATLMDHVEMARRVADWIEKGRRVREWLEEQGLEGESWLPTT